MESAATWWTESELQVWMSELVAGKGWGMEKSRGIGVEWNGFPSTGQDF